LTRHDSHYLLRLHKDVSFLNKALLRKHLANIPDNSTLVIDGSRALFIDQDILETIADFLIASPDREIEVDLQGFAVDSPLLQISSDPSQQLALATGH